MCHFFKVVAVSVALAFVLMSSGSLRAEDQKPTADDVIKAVKAAIQANEKASDKVKAFAEKALVPMCTNAVLVAECKAQNDKKVTLEEIKKIDEEWSAAEDMLPIQEEKTTNACAQELKKFIGANAMVLEAFAMDNQGANVGQTGLTSDYWQGDEAKWKNSYNEGKGGVDVGSVEMDKSANAQLQQVSVPIVDADGTVIGAITFGINVDIL